MQYQVQGGEAILFFAPRCFGDQLRIVTVIPNPPGPLRISPDHLKCPSQIRLQALPPPSLHTAATSTSGCGTPTPDEHHSTLSFAASVAGRCVSAALAKHRTLPPISSGLVTSLCFGALCTLSNRKRASPLWLLFPRAIPNILPFSLFSLHQPTKVPPTPVRRPTQQPGSWQLAPGSRQLRHLAVV